MWAALIATAFFSSNRAGFGSTRETSKAATRSAGENTSRPSPIEKPSNAR